MKPNLTTLKNTLSTRGRIDCKIELNRLIEELRQLKKEDCFDIPIDSILGENTQ